MEIRKNNQINMDTQRTVWGTTKNPDGTDFEWWTNVAVNHINGRLSNETLLKMTDQELTNLVDKEGGLERYRRPTDRKLAEKQGGYIDEEYDGLHRAHIILMYRRAIKVQNQ